MFDLTKQERQVIIFVLAVCLTGIGVKAIVKLAPIQERRSFLDNLGKADLNTADKETLTRIPGIGEKLAQRIIEYRERNNGFSDLDELDGIKGVTRKTAEKLKDCVFIR